MNFMPCKDTVFLKLGAKNGIKVLEYVFERNNK